MGGSAPTSGRSSSSNDRVGEVGHHHRDRHFQYVFSRMLKIIALLDPSVFPGRCVGNTTPVSRLGIPALCFNDGPAGVRLSQGVTGFPTGINVASTFSRRLMRARGVALGEEFRGRGIQ